MRLKCFFDASFRKESNEGIIAALIKDQDGKILLKSIKTISCNSSVEAEYRALNKVVGNLIDKQAKEMIPKGINIIILGDCKSVIDTALKNKKIRGVEKDITSGLLKNISYLHRSNDMELIWIPRKLNDAHQIIKR